MFRAKTRSLEERGGKPEAPAQAAWDPPTLLNWLAQDAFKDLKEIQPKC